MATRTTSLTLTSLPASLVARDRPTSCTNLKPASRSPLGSSRDHRRDRLTPSRLLDRRFTADHGVKSDITGLPCAKWEVCCRATSGPHLGLASGQHQPPGTASWTTLLGTTARARENHRPPRRPFRSRTKTRARRGNGSPRRPPRPYPSGRAAGPDWLPSPPRPGQQRLLCSPG